MSKRMDVVRSYEKALLAGRMGEVGGYLTDDVRYWVAGAPPIGGTWEGRAAVVRCFEKREAGLGAAPWGYEDVSRVFYEADKRVIVEIRERSWLPSAPGDVMDQKTCVVIRFRGDRICEMQDFTDSHVYEEFVKRHKAELAKFA
jgi:ketosteroid isomerase-like protein